ncbi:MAG: 30S ribosomal protein S7 [Candidatus Thermoplasmatota archaeon]
MASEDIVENKLNFFPVLEKYNMDEVVIEDKGLEKYINLDVENIYLGGVNSDKMFAKSKTPVVERLINKTMITSKYTGKKIKSYKVMKKAFEIIDKKTGTNPLQVLINAIQNAAPKEETTRLRFGGISVPKAVDVAPLRRIDIALRNIADAAFNASKSGGKNIEKNLADELIKASNNDMSSFSVSRKNEIERVAKSAR